MSENQESIDADEVESQEPGKRQRSTIAFPYTDYDAAATAARAIHTNAGHGRCSTDQIAAWLGVSSKSSGYRTQLAAARLFGLIESDDSESYRLTDLGQQVVDQNQMRRAKAEAFLRVPLFKALYEKYKSGVVPPTAALEREIASLGVSEKQKARARQVFEGSAEQTGFREHGADRLVMPAVVVTLPSQGDTEKNGNGGGGGSGGGDSEDDLEKLGLDPLILALLRKIPLEGEDWPAAKRLRWFQTFAMNVSQVYDDDENPIELSISLPAKKQNQENN